MMLKLVLMNRGICAMVIFRGTGGTSKLSAFRLRKNFMKVHGLTGHRI